MKQFVWVRNRAVSGTGNSAWDLGMELGVVYNKEASSYEAAWDQYATNILDELSQWCKASGIKDFATGHTQIAIQITFQHSKDAVLFKLRWHNV